SPKIRVCIRKRPLNAKELSSHSPDSLTVRTSSHPNAHIYVHRPHRRLDGTPATTTHRFLFDDVFDEHASNLLVYSAAVRPLVRAMFKRGGRCSLFCYGQTGSGKTYTVFGPEGGRPGAPGDPGIHQHACADIFRLLSLANRRRAPRNLPALNCTASYFELYGGRVFDLLARRAPRQMMEDARGDVQVVGLTRVRVGSAEECRRQVERGNTERTTGRTEANDTSSRSHAVFQVVVWESGAGVGELDGVGGTVLPGGDKVFSKFSLIDLAGSERGQDTGKGGTRRQRMEASEINKSLLALKECIRALHARQPSGPVCPPHVPFRASKLTHLLRDSFVHRSSRTVMVAAVGPSAGGVEHTLNTLRYAGR
ncbi:kinesin-domain-containing protein, partial [Gonapodya prolifera JEL478]